MVKKNIFLLLVVIPSLLQALPTGPTVHTGGANISTSGSNTQTVEVTATNNKIEWQGFSIAYGETVNFKTASSIAGQNYHVLNVVTGSSPSTIEGLMQSDSKGNIMLINPGGITFTSRSFCLVGTLLVSTLSMVDDFVPGNDVHLRGSSTANVHNQGTILTTSGDAVLVGYRVLNDSKITAADAVVAGAGVDLVYKPTDANRIYVQTSGASGTGTGLELASSGTLTGKTVAAVADGNIYSQAINQAGIIEATTCVANEGKVYLVADGKTTGNGDVLNSGTIRRSETGGDGCNVEIYGANIRHTGTIDLSSDGHGGSIKLGDATDFPAKTVYVGSDAVLRSNSLSQGNGGTINSYGSEESDVLGNVYTKGAGTGTGGDVNFTSPGRLKVDLADVDMTGASGNHGTFIATSSDMRSAGNSSSTGSVVTKDSLEKMLAKGHVAHIANAESGSGSLYFSDNDFTWHSGNKLTLHAKGTLQMKNKGTMTKTGMSGINVLHLKGENIIIGTSTQDHATAAGINLTSGDISVDAVNTIGLYGGNATGANALIQTGDGTNAVSFGKTMDLHGGHGSGSHTDIGGTTTTVDAKTAGVGDIDLLGGDCSHARISGATVKVGTNVKPKDILLTGAHCGTEHDATIGHTTAASDIDVRATGNLNVTGGGGGSGNHGQIHSSLGNKNINVDVGSLSLNGGSSGSNNFARISHEGSSGRVKVKTAQDAAITGGSSGAMLSGALIQGPKVALDIGRDITVTGGDHFSNHATILGTTGVSGIIGRHCTLTGGTKRSAYGQVTAFNGNITLDNPGSAGIWALQGGANGNDNVSSQITTDKGDILLGQNSPPAEIKVNAGQTGDEPIARILTTTSGDIKLKATNDVNLVGGGQADKNSHATVTSNKGDIHIESDRDISIKSGTHQTSHSTVEAVSGTAHITPSRDLTMVGDCDIPNKALVQGSDGVKVSAGRDISMRGWSVINVQSGSGALELNHGGNFTVADCSCVSKGGVTFYHCANSNLEDTSSLPGSLWYRYAFLYEGLYRTRYYQWYDWYLFHSTSIWNRYMYTSP